VLSEDVTCVRPGPVPSVIPGPAMLRIRPDVARWLDVHHAVRIEGGDGRVHVALDVDRRGDCTAVPLREIMLLRGARETARWEPIAPQRAIRDLWSVSSRIPTSSGRARCFEDLVDVVGRVPIGDLYRAEHDTDLAPLLDLIARHP
jgi:hypothetical protein